MTVRGQWPKNVFAETPTRKTEKRMEHTGPAISVCFGWADHAMSTDVRLAVGRGLSQLRCNSSCACVHDDNLNSTIFL